MTTPDALLILQRLADGIDPQTGEIYPADSPYQRPQTVRALYAAISSLQNTSSPVPVKTSAQVDNEPTVLTLRQQEIFEKLRRWRGKQAEAEGFPVYVIAHNRMLTDMVVQSVTDETGLLAIKGFGANRVRKYGTEILDILNSEAEIADSSVVLVTPIEDTIAHTLESAQAQYSFSRFYPILITEVTQMQKDHLCIAGFDIHTGKMVRPLLPNAVHWTSGGARKPFVPGQLVNAIPVATP